MIYVIHMSATFETRYTSRTLQS